MSDKPRDKEELLEWVESLPENIMVESFSFNIIQPKSFDMPRGGMCNLIKYDTVIRRVGLNIDLSWQQKVS